MPQPSGQSCGTCRYYVPRPEYAGGSTSGLSGACHRYAPQPLGAPVIPWPFVGASDWCGEWEQSTESGQAVSVELVAGTPRPQ